jgi:hypothetical protein
MTHRVHSRTAYNFHHAASAGCNCALAKVMGRRKSVAEKSSGVAVQEVGRCQCRTRLYFGAGGPGEGLDTAAQRIGGIEYRYR